MIVEMCVLLLNYMNISEENTLFQDFVRSTLGSVYYSLHYCIIFLRMKRCVSYFGSHFNFYFHIFYTSSDIITFIILHTQ